MFNEENYFEGAEFTYSILRGEETFDSTIALRGYNLEDFVRSYWIQILVVLSFMSISLLVVLQKPLDQLSWVFLLFSAIGSFSMFGGDTFVAMSGSRLAELIYILYYSFYFPLSTLLLIHFAAEFPSPVYSTKLRKYLWPTLYGAYFLFLAFSVYSSLASDSRQVLLNYGNIGTYIGIVFGLAGFILLLYRYFRAYNSTQKSQIRLPIMSFIFVLVVGLVFYQIGWVVFHTTILDYELIILSTLVLPVSIAISISQYHLFQIERLVTKGIVYGLLTTGLSGIYLLISVGLSLLFNQTLSLQLPSVETIASLVIFILLLQPGKEFLQKVIDRFFYRTSPNLTQLVRDIGK